MSMLKDIGEVRDFIIWCREAQVLAVELGELKVHFAPSAYTRDVPQSPEPPKGKVDPGTGYTEDELYP